jgi:hypothetical protein
MMPDVQQDLCSLYKVFKQAQASHDVPELVTCFLHTCRRTSNEGQISGWIFDKYQPVLALYAHVLQLIINTNKRLLLDADPDCLADVFRQYAVSVGTQLQEHRSSCFTVQTVQVGRASLGT